ncbi:hypothetical protein Pcinc_033440 [Petrolisthes cinctipes]|uniref:C2H2-type domain-containing protein n=1 Tax=Petrolisthes cinctipes TaxID=88211 RepID=A0AAE1ESE5_PETCI|nr:hypothetical protein Pcinc_033440 [Petrolisthes cinctipes]
MESELREHHRIHLPDRPFLCNVCGMTFKQKKRLRVHHRAVHLRDKRFVCNVCGSSHINNWNLQTHMTTHTQMDAMCHNMCDQCGSMFRGRAGLAAHIRLRHSDTRQQQQQQQQQHQEQHQQHHTNCYHLCDSWEHLASHMQRNHHLLLYPELVP